MDKIKELIKLVLEKGFLMSLATVDKNGPWVSDVIYVYDDKLNLYFLSEVNTRHSKAIINNPKVAVSITVWAKQGDDNIGLQLEGRAKKINGDIFQMAIKHRLKRNKKPPKKEGEILGPNESWYCLKPTKIELIYEPLYGFNKKELKLK